jgi:2-oxoglutarate dehydrogenase E2 component (dihydrolipoamide succinyltransferase)
MILEIKIPSPGESITEVELARWLVTDGSLVQKNQELAEVESDKATLPIIAEQSGKLKIIVEEGIRVAVGKVVCSIDTSVEVSDSLKPEPKTETITEKPAKQPETNKKEVPSLKSDYTEKVKITPLAKKLMTENNLDVSDVLNGLRKITTEEVKMVIDSKSKPDAVGKVQDRSTNHEKMSQLRRKISERLVAVKNQTAMLTTFNEVDMSAVMELRNKYQKDFQEKHQVKLGFMSFFTKAVANALSEFPKLNSYIEGEEIVSPNFIDIGIAVQSDKGLMVPVLRNAENLSIPQIENQIAEMAKKARSYRLSPEEMSGGTFTITNGGVFGSLLSTPIINPPQSGILGMHNIVERPVALNGQVVIRPMMYIALSYDHRIVDGRDSVSFLVAVKRYIETPYKLFLSQSDPEKLLLGL